MRNLKSSPIILHMFSVILKFLVYLGSRAIVHNVFVRGYSKIADWR